MFKLTAIISLTFCLASCEGAGTSPGAGKEDLSTDLEVVISADTTKPATQTPSNKYYPFELQETGGRYQVVANIESKELYPKYYEFFQKHGYEGNGPCWEGHIRQILEKLDRKLLSQIEFNPEAGAFFANVSSKEDQIRFTELLSPIFSDLEKLAEWVNKADRSRIDD